MWRQPRRGWAEGMVGLAVVVLVAMLLLMPMPPEVPVADVVESANAHWSQAGIRPAAGRMAPGTYDLDRGAIKLRTTTGVEVNLEAPCQFRLRGANQLHLDFGVLYAEARGSDPDFTVLTPTALVHDLGTAFGVEVDQAGSTEAVVMEGKVAMSTPGARPEQSVVIPKDYRSRVLADAGVVEPVKEIINPHVFERYPRKVLQRVWLASLLCEQTSGNLMDCHCGLNVTNGESLTWEQRITSPDAGDWERESDGAYIETPQLAAIDGVFVPNPNGVIDRTGRTFEQFNTANRIWTFGDVWVGRPFPMRVGFVNEHRDRLDRAGIGRYAISMHAPKGITVDLQQVSALNGNLTPKRFKASLFNYGDHDSQPNIWVIIDGQLVYHNPGLKTQDGIVPVEIELPHGAQYLTLAATVDEPFCWVAIDQAVFELGTSPVEEQ